MKKLPLQKRMVWGLLAGAVVLSAVPSEAFRFIATGDTRGNNNGVNTLILGESVQAAIDEGADFILVTGDLVNGSTDPAILQSQLTTWRNTVQPLYDLGIAVYPCRGNHDAGSKAAWDAVFAGAYGLPGNGPPGEENITYSFVYENSLFIALDQYGSHLNRVNQTWLDAELASNTLPHVFIFGHVPAFSVYHLDCLDDYPNERNLFWQSIAEGCGRIYLTGHDHFYNHARLDDGDGNADNDLHQLIAGAGGAPMYEWNGIYGGNNGPWMPQLVFHEKQYGYVLAEVTDATVTLTWKHRIGPGAYQEGGDMLSFTYADTDGDGRGETCDNCPDLPNAVQEDADADRVGDACDNCPATPNQNQLDTYPPGGNNCGDACECHADCNGDKRVDLADLVIVKTEFLRTDCAVNPCDADCNYDNKVDVSDLVLTKQEFLRTDCPACP